MTEDPPSKDLANFFCILTHNDPSIADKDCMDCILSAIADCSSIDPAGFSPDSEPWDWKDSQTRPPAKAAEWHAVFEDECKSLKDMGVYTLVLHSDVPTDCKVHKGKPVLKNKIDLSGQLARHKVRFVFKGYEQIYGKDYTTTTSPTAQMESWHILLHIAATLDWDV